MVPLRVFVTACLGKIHLHVGKGCRSRHSVNGLRCDGGGVGARAAAGLEARVSAQMGMLLHYGQTEDGAFGRAPAHLLRHRQGTRIERFGREAFYCSCGMLTLRDGA